MNIRYDSTTNLPVGEFYYLNGTKKRAWDIDATHDAVPLENLPFGLYEAFRATASLDLPIGKDSTALYWRPGVVFTIVSESYNGLNNIFPSQNEYAGLQVGLRYLGEVQKPGASFPQSGAYFDLTAAELLGVDAYKTRTTELTGTARAHATLPWKHHGVHLILEGGSFVTGDVNNPNAIFTAGGRASFPYTLGSAYTLNGFDPNTIIASGLGVGTFIYTIPVFDIDRGLDTYPLYFEKTTLALVGQAATGRIQGIPWSYGAELHQSFMMGYVYNMDFTIGAYVGSVQQGGTTEVVFSLAFNDPKGDLTTHQR